MRRFPRADIAPRVAEMLSLVRLDGLGARRPHELSGGQQQRVAIARALAFGPDLLLLDEPLSALDKALREDMQLEFRRIQQDLGVTAINVTHDQREALVMSDRIVVMDAGQVEQADTPQGVYHAPQTRFVATFLGVTTLFPARVAEAGERRLAVEADGTRLAARGSAPHGAWVDCAVRAEHVTVGPRDAPPSGENRLDGTVVRVVFEGDRTTLAVAVPALGGAELLAFVRDTAPHLRPGAEVTAAFSGEDLFAFPTTTTTRDEP